MSEDTLTPFNSTVCIVGGGPSGMMLGYLLARQGIDVTVVEAQKDFDRKFRGDTLHTSILENIGELGLMAKLEALPHTKVQQMVSVSNGKRIVMGDLSLVKNRPYPYMMMVAQPLFLQLLADEAVKYPNFRLLMGASAQELIEEENVVKGVRYRQGREWGEVNAALVIGCDGRSSKVRKVGNFELTTLADPMEVLWVSIPKNADQIALESGNSFGSVNGFATHERVDRWHIGLPSPQGTYSELKSQGIDYFRQMLIQARPEIQSQIETNLQAWRDVTLLKVQSARVDRWYCEGMLLIGDAAHVMSPIMGVGINLAVQDAIATSNILTPILLKQGYADLNDLAKVQKRRLLPTRIMQGIQTWMQKRLPTPTLQSEMTSQFGDEGTPLSRIPLIGSYMSQMGLRMVAFGIRPENVHLINSKD